MLWCRSLSWFHGVLCPTTLHLMTWVPVANISFAIVAQVSTFNSCGVMSMLLMISKTQSLLYLVLKSIECLFLHFDFSCFTWITIDCKFWNSAERSGERESLKSLRASEIVLKGEYGSETMEILQLGIWKLSVIFCPYRMLHSVLHLCCCMCVVAFCWSETYIVVYSDEKGMMITAWLACKFCVHRGVQCPLFCISIC